MYHQTLSLSVNKVYAHWHHTFNVFVHSIQANNSVRPNTLVNFVSSTVYEYIAECDDYESAIDTLKAFT